MKKNQKETRRIQIKDLLVKYVEDTFGPDFLDAMCEENLIKKAELSIDLDLDRLTYIVGSLLEYIELQHGDRNIVDDILMYDLEIDRSEISKLFL